MAEEVKKYTAPKEVEDIIRNHVLGAVGLGFVPVPVVDVVGLMGVQLDLINKLSGYYNITFKENMAKNIISTLIGGVTPVALTPFAFSLLKIIPVVGYTTSAVSLCIMGGGSTYAIGRIFAKHFANGGNIEDLKVDDVKEEFAEAYEDGKKVAKDSVAALKEKKDAEAAADKQAVKTKPAELKPAVKA